MSTIANSEEVTQPNDEEVVKPGEVGASPPEHETVPAEVSDGAMAGRSEITDATTDPTKLQSSLTDVEHQRERPLGPHSVTTHLDGKQSLDSEEPQQVPYNGLQPDEITESHQLISHESITEGASIRPGTLHSQISENRQSVRSKTLTEKGLMYQIDQSLSGFRNSVKNLKRVNTMAINYLGRDSLDPQELYEYRHKLEKVVDEIANSYYKIGDYSVQKLAEFKGEFDECTFRVSATLFQVAQAIKLFNIEDRSKVSVRSNHAPSSRRHKGSRTSSSSSNSSRSSKHSSVSSTTSMKAAAAAKAAEGRAKLKFVEVENEQKSQLEKTRL